MKTLANPTPASKIGHKITPLPPQSEDVFTPATYRAFLEQFEQNLQEYSRLYDLHLEIEPQKRLRSPENEQMKLLEYQRSLMRREYLRRLPFCLVAWCPYCGSRVRQPVDIFSFMGFYPLINISRGYHGRDRYLPRERCKHTLLSMVSVNLHGSTLDDLPEWALKRERWMRMGSAPYVMVWPLIARQTSAVVHTVPIGRLDDPVPIHRYTAYFVTYFAGDETNLYTEEMWVPTDLGGPATGAVQIDTNLVKWVRAGRLFWLDTNDVNRLVKESTEAFPYAHIRPQGSYVIIEGGQVDGPTPYHKVWRGSAPPHDESFPKTIE